MENNNKSILESELKTLFLKRINLEEAIEKIDSAKELLSRACEEIKISYEAVIEEQSLKSNELLKLNNFKDVESV